MPTQKRTPKPRRRGRSGTGTESPVTPTIGHARSGKGSVSPSKALQTAPGASRDVGHARTPKARQRPIEAFLAGRAEKTKTAYASDLRAFALWLNVATPEEAIAYLLDQSAGDANALALDWKADMLEAKAASATVGRRLATLRSLTRAARMTGRITWQLDVSAPKGEAYRDTKGPGAEGVDRMLAATPGDSFVGARDRAIIRMLFDLALRRSEVAELTLDRIDLNAKTVSILGKGRRERQELTIPAPTLAAVRAWLKQRATRALRSQHVFVNVDPTIGEGKKTADERLTDRSIARIVNRAGRRAGLEKRVAPHALRHAAITTALDEGHDPRSVMRFSRHRRLDTLMLYDDARHDTAGDIAGIVAGSAKGTAPKAKVRRNLRPAKVLAKTKVGA
jgi:integrase/recombinase XerC